MRKPIGRAYISTTLLMAGLSGSAMAADNNASLHGILAGTYQAVSESEIDGQDVDGEGNGELYLMGTLDMGPGAWQIEVRGSTTPADNGVTTYYGSNALVGETTDADGDGRIAATQLFYELPVGPGAFRAGLLDPTALLDGNDSANDEYSQFLAGTFVNNPTIEFPSFVLGGGYHGEVTNQTDTKLFVGSSSGLQGDDPTYDNVVDVDEDGKGVFAAGELGWHPQDYNFAVGGWVNTRDHLELSGSGDDEAGYGTYALVGGPVGTGRWQARAGIADDDVQADANFLSLAYQRPLRLASRDTTLGLAVARRGDSDELAFDSKPIYHTEAYWRINVAGSFYVSPNIQYIDNAGFRADRDGVVIGGVRASVAF